MADPAEVDEDLVRDVPEILTSLCARLYGRRAAADRAAGGVQLGLGQGEGQLVRKGKRGGKPVGFPRLIVNSGRAYG